MLKKVLFNLGILIYSGLFVITALVIFELLHIALWWFLTSGNMEVAL